jgi:regulatory protein
LRASAIRMLARREYSRAEISGRLGARAQSAEQLEAVLDQLAAEGLLSEARFAASLARRRSQRFGTARLAQELKQHRIDPSIAEPLLGAAHQSERERALAVWSTRFGAPAASLTEKARQYRFLTQRGFSGETVNWVLRASHAHAHGADRAESPGAARRNPRSDSPD